MSYTECPTESVGDIPNDSFSNSDHMSYTEYPTESVVDVPDYNMELAELTTEGGEFDPSSFLQLFTNVSRVYMYSKRIFEDISFFKCKPQMKLDICICFLENFGLGDENWVGEMKQLSIALSARFVISSVSRDLIEVKFVWQYCSAT
ncbi:hypothetical protein MKW94_026770 [Papaver nudicaule]|uniref:Uncharacterized protein n=1 Tax=Papaver nudicaule TaxID=74823 RepID=A0AA41S003_PAPNU|nr:hypothetical protein [Papaver nudicaule]